jgi:UDP-N-acetylglucosamine 2-epimerase (non-hydrolysing)
MKKIAIIVGTRPECIKMAPIYFALKESKKLEPILISTGQHRQMLDQTLSVFGLTPDFDLNLMQPGQTLPDLTGRVLLAMTDWLTANKPSAVLVQGDTTTVLASALAAFYQQIPIGHVEAGLRTGNMLSPWPEEMNRRLTSPLAQWNFCPTSVSRDNLLREGIEENKIYVTGNSVIDALLHVQKTQQSKKINSLSIIEKVKIPQKFVSQYLVEKNQPWILVTGHRRESFGGGFERICDAINQLTEAHPNVGILYPVHLNPKVQEIVREKLASNSRVALIAPVAYEEFVWLMNKCTFLLSDSGGVQEEAPSLGKPVLVMRETTERPEGVEAGTCRLVGTDVQKIIKESLVLLNDEAEYLRRSQLKNPYGDGNTSRKIAEILEKNLSL